MTCSGLNRLKLSSHGASTRTRTRQCTRLSTRHVWTRVTVIHRVGWALGRVNLAASRIQCTVFFWLSLYSARVNAYILLVARVHLFKVVWYSDQTCASNQNLSTHSNILMHVSSSTNYCISKDYQRLLGLLLSIHLIVQILFLSCLKFPFL